MRTYPSNRAKSLNNEYEFVKACGQVDFVIIGFTDKVFTSQVLNLTSWAETPAVRKKVIYARDNNERLSHPRRWRTEGYLMEKAIKGLVEVLKFEANEGMRRGFTFLR